MKINKILDNIMRMMHKMILLDYLLVKLLLLFLKMQSFVFYYYQILLMINKNIIIKNIAIKIKKKMLNLLKMQFKKLLKNI